MTHHRLSLALVVALAAAIPTGIGPVAAASADPGEVALTCFPHAPAEVRYDDTWGAARSGGRGHKGTDILSPKGVHVLAVADGTVVGLENGSSSGYYVRLAHEGGWETYYMHLDNDTPGTDDGAGGPEAAFAPGLAVGDTVRAGDHIGFVGDSGNAEWTTSHTHFELHIGGGAVNPYPYVADVEHRLDEVTDRLTAAATLDGEGMAAVRDGDLWDELVGAMAAGCLPKIATQATKRVFGAEAVTNAVKGARPSGDDLPDTDLPDTELPGTGADGTAPEPEDVILDTVAPDRFVAPPIPLGGQ